MQQKIVSDIPAYNMTGVISWEYPIYEVTEEYSKNEFSKEKHSEIICMRQNCEAEDRILVFSPPLGAFGKALNRDRSMFKKYFPSYYTYSATKVVSEGMR